jgi:hypothetical protein
MTHIFISYSRQDIDFARYLRALLEHEHFYVWMDEARIPSGSRWWKDIEKNIDTCAAFIIVMSPDAYESDWVEREILRAEQQKKPIFPVLAAGDAWSRLANLQFEDMRAGLQAVLPMSFVKTLRMAGLPPAPDRQIVLTIQQSDILEYEADVVALKHAQKFHGADLAVLNALSAVGIVEEAIAPTVGDYRYIKTEGAMVAPQVLSVGTPLLRHLGYKQLREFAARVLSALAEVAPQTQHLAMTIHGPGFGLDELEALRSQLAGYQDALQAGRYPLALRQISIVEFQENRLERLRAAVEADFAERVDVTPLEAGWGYHLHLTESSTAVPIPTRSKPHMFVVMPPEEDLDDIFYFGIQTPAHALGLLCERIEAKQLTDDLLEQARQRIDTASVVIVALTRPDPHVYLQMGYAWGKGRPMIVIARDHKVFEFESGGVRLVYNSIKHLESSLSKTLKQLKAQGKIV